MSKQVEPCAEKEFPLCAQTKIIRYSEILIRCNGENTSVLVDGTELATRCSRIYFEHDAEKNENSISLTLDVHLCKNDK